MQNIKEVFLKAIKTEQDGIEFYAKAEKQTRHPLGKKMFSSFIADEKTHLRILKNLTEEMLSAEDRGYLKEKGPKAKLRTAFQESTSRAEKVTETNPDDIQALQIAMNMESEGYKYYTNAAKQATDPDIKALLSRLAKDENDHFEILQNTLFLLEKSGNWFLWEEKGLLDGG